MNATARTFILVALVVVVLLAMHLLPPLQVGGQELRRVSVLSDVLPEPYRQLYAIDVIPTVPQAPFASSRQWGEKRTQAPQTGEPDANKNLTTAEDSTVKAQSPIGGEESADPSNGGEARKDVSPIVDYSGGAPGGMDSFYAKLYQIAHLGRPVRIAFYGDSFIEGDIMTGDLRERLQERFGGNGVGWVDCGNNMNGFRRTVRQKFSGLCEYEVVKKPFSHACEGISQRYFVPDEGATVWMAGTKYKPHARQWQCSTLYLRSEGGLEVTTSINGDSTITSRLDGTTAVQALSWTGNARHVGYSFRHVSPQTYIYGMAMEGSGGIVLDNFSMRGSSGATLAKIPKQTLNDFARLRPYDLIVLLFGLNVANDRSHAANYKAYTRQMRETVSRFRAAYPDAGILVAGVPDRDQRTQAGIRTVNGIEALSAYQQIMASDCHVAFFNTFEAMGGRESMRRLVDRHLANKDYTHLNHDGGRHVAGFFFESLMAGYENYKSRQHHD